MTAVLKLYVLKSFCPRSKDPFLVFLWLLLASSVFVPAAEASVRSVEQQTGSAQPATATAPTPPPAAQPGSDQNTQEMTTHEQEMAPHDEVTTFKVNVKLVEVRVVVRDSKGHALGNLHKEDFQILDKGKPQLITQFAV